MAAPLRAPPAGAPTEPALPKPFGRYTLLRRIAAGGMAELYLALHRSVAGFEKLVVIKRILPSMTDNRAFIDMLLHEARVAATLTHPNIVHVYDVGEVDGAWFIAMEHIHGEDLVAILGAMAARGLTRFPMEHALGIVLGVCAGLAYAHDKRDFDGAPLGIVHRDVSPRNIVVTFTGDVKLVDFGIAKSEVLPGEETGSGQLKGKASYMSPEQASGQSVDARTDVFAAGVVLFELTTGRRLFKGQSEFETLKLIVDKEYPRPSELCTGYPPALERIVMRALAKRREDRYPSARDMQADLEAFVREERVAVSAVSRGRWMEALFVEKLARQSEALFDMKQLADEIAREGSDGEDMASTVGPPTAFSAARPPPRRNAALAAGALVLAMAAGGAFLLRQGDRPPSLSQAAATRPGAVTVVLKIDPPPALLLDGKPWSGDRGKLEGLSPGDDHTIVASAPGCQTRTYVIRGQQGETRTITDTLARVDGGI